MEQIEHPVEMIPALADQPEYSNASPSERMPEAAPRRAELSAEVRAFFTTQGSLSSEASTLEAPVKVISYMGSASNKIGNNGDFYLDEMTNILYGPKANGAWPEEGIEVDGPVLCKRNFIQLNPSRIAGRRRQMGNSKSPAGVFRFFYFFLRLIRPSKYGHSLTLQN